MKAAIEQHSLNMGNSFPGHEPDQIVCCDLVACGLGPYSRTLAQFFPIRTSRPANNIYGYCKLLLLSTPGYKPISFLTKT